MKFPSKKLLFTGALAWLLAFALSGINPSRNSSSAPQDAAKQRAWTGGALPFEGVAFAQAPAGSKPLMSEQVFKNIQVLKGIPVDEFMGTMGLFSAALNVC